MWALALHTHNASNFPHIEPVRDYLFGHEGIKGLFQFHLQLIIKLLRETNFYPKKMIFPFLTWKVCCCQFYLWYATSDFTTSIRSFGIPFLCSFLFVWNNFLLYLRIDLNTNSQSLLFYARCGGGAFNHQTDIWNHLGHPLRLYVRKRGSLITSGIPRTSSMKLCSVACWRYSYLRSKYQFMYSEPELKWA